MPPLTWLKALWLRLLPPDIPRQLAEEMARHAQTMQWLLMAEEIAHVGHWRIGVPGYEIYWSDEIYRIHGLAKESYTPEIVSAIKVFHPLDREMIQKKIADTVSGKAEYEWQARLIRPNGEIRHVLSRGIPQYNKTGALTGIFGVFIDITDQKRIEENLRTANLRAAKENIQLQELALFDSLTGLRNRRHFEAALETEFQMARRHRKPLGLVMIDLDHFKAYNDLYGHPAGDDCLRKVTAAIMASLQRPADLAARYGGEEIVLLLPETDETGAHMTAKRVAASVRGLLITHKGNPPSIVTISCGVAVYNEHYGTSAASILVQRADQALYEAKQRGRNRVRLCSLST